MTKWAPIAIAGAAGLALIVAKTAASKSRCLDESAVEPSIWLLGDSLTGTGSYSRTVAAGLRKQYPGAKIRVTSLSGKGVAAIKNEALKVIDEINPDAVVLLAGVNDLASGRGVPYVTRELNHAYRSFSERGYPVIAVTLTPWDSHSKGQDLRNETAEVNAFIRQTPIPCSVVDASKIGGQGLDGLHLTADGGIQLARAVLKDGFSVK